MTYPYESIWINGREVSINSILDHSAKDQNDFEKLTFNFIYDWLTGKELFELETSGSTGTPKQISISRDQMIASARMTQQALKLDEGFTALLCLSPNYIAGKMMLVRTLVIGMKLIALTPSANVFEKIPETIPVDFTAMVPYQIYNVVRSKESPRLNRIKSILIGGAALDDESRSILNSFTCQCYATYGMTETISHVALQLLKGSDRSDAFNLLPGIKIELDERGCIVISAPYLHERIITNDLGSMLTEHSFKWLGRWDNVINSGGVKIIPEVLEKKLELIFKAVGINRNFIVSSIPDSKLSNRLILLVEGDELPPRQVSMLRDHLLKSVEPYEIPKEVLMIPNFVYSENGKLKRRETSQNCDKTTQNFTLKF